MPEMHALVVGQPYLSGGTRLPESVQYNYRGGGHELLMVLRGLTSRERAAVATGPAEFALYADGTQIIMLYRFGTAIPWSDAPYTIHRVPERERVIPPPVETPEPHALLTVILVQQETGVVRALRTVTFSPAFTVALHAAIRKQAETPYDPATYDRDLAALYRRYPTSSALLTQTISRTHGGR